MSNLIMTIDTDSDKESKVPKTKVKAQKGKNKVA